MQLEIAFLPFRGTPVGQITCDRSHRDYDLCSINGPTLLDPRAATLFALDPTNLNPPTTSLKIRPYPRKSDEDAMSSVQEFNLTSFPPKFSCGVTHYSPAIVFSAGGYTGNFFHDFGDGFVPLFITVNSLFSNQDIILVISDVRGWWPQKYVELLSRISNHPIIDLNKENTVHCFPSSIVGLITHGTMKVDPNLLQQPKTLLSFHTFLENAYTREITQSTNRIENVRPRMILISRKGNISRVILNEKKVVKAAEEVGFDVVVFDPIKNSSLSNAFKLIAASHAMLGVHGAGLTHFLFLRPGSVLMQVVPLAMEGASRSCYESPGKDLGLKYIEYKIEAKESSLLEIYGNSSLVIRDPQAVVGGKWKNMHLYLKNQNVKIDLSRFRRYLREAYEKANRFMDIEG